MIKAHNLYTAEQTRELDRLAIEQGTDGYALMNRAGRSVLDNITRRWPDAKQLAIFCGAGNNAGDGYVVARLAHEQGLVARVYYLSEPARLNGEAHQAWEECKQLDLTIEPFVSGMHRDTDVVIDALVGTGLQRPLADQWLQAVDCINVSPWPVVAVDIPSGINADNGRTMGAAVRADITVSFIGLNRGLFTAEAPEYTGEIIYEDLEVPEICYESVATNTFLIDDGIIQQFHARSRIVHKGQCGHVLVIGGNSGMAGAPLLAGRAALRSGAGLVSIATRPQNTMGMVSAQPELMVHGIEEVRAVDRLIDNASVIVIGPGLGRDSWAHGLLDRVMQSRKPMVVDADGLTLLAHEPARCENWVLTPHVGEAARLLGSTNDEVSNDRFSAVVQIQQQYGGVAVLKGAGTLVSSSDIRLCPYGNPGMATAGMGDILSGIIGALMAQGLAQARAAELAVWAHARAGDIEAEANGERGMVAGDILNRLRTVLNG
ncbi:MAG TPA: NAD(P)H-hydrate dehydratase [Gammaproteobacteria bacterium]|jgi:NAD(P)H-hydrate epimerase